MTTEKTQLTKNARLYLTSEFLWNFARTLPHAILTVYLLTVGISLTQIAAIQSIYMAVAMISEFPSGIIADYFSRKSIYLVSGLVILLSYILIGFWGSNFAVLALGYALYGLSTALKTGTLDAELIIEYRKSNRDIKNLSVATSYTMNVSSMLGGLSGGFLYSYFENNIYIISIVFFIVSLIIGNMCHFCVAEKSNNIQMNLESVKTEYIRGVSVLKEQKNLKIIILLFAITSLFLQPFYQYWQVLYQEQEIPISYFGLLYIIFQICNIIATWIYKNIRGKNRIYTIILAFIPITFMAGLLLKNFVVFVFPIVIILFYIYAQHLDVILKNNSPQKHMSSYISLVGSVTNISSVFSLFLMAFFIQNMGILVAYAIMFFIFSVISIFFISRYRNILTNFVTER